MKQTFFALLFAFLLQTTFAQLIEEGSVWKYLDDGSNQGTAWQQPGFNDNSWESGHAQLGYGDGDEATVLSYGGDPSHKYITYYFRKTFNVTDPDEKPAITIGIVRDDGAVVYINGTEAFRSNMPSGTITYLTLAAHTISGDAEDIFNNYQVPSSMLQSGVNTIAVEIHQRSETSSDISFDLRMEFSDLHFFKKEPYLLYTAENTEMLVLWQMDSTRVCQFEWGTDTTYAIGSETTVEYNEDHQHKIMLENLEPGTKYYYRVSYETTSVKTGNFYAGAPDNQTNLSFYVYGDTRSNPSAHNSVAEQVVQEVELSPESQTFIISTGDLVADGDNESDWQEQFFSADYEYIRQMMAELPYLAAVGNHEGQGALFKKYFPYPMFASSRYYYSFDYGPAHFTVMDQFTSYYEGSPQYEWLVNDLASSNKPWKFMVLHEPGWSAGGGHANNTQVQQLIQPLCETYGVQFVLTGHNHYYARAVVNNIDHITAGGGGAPLYNPNPNADSIVIVDKTYHYCRIDIADDTLTFTATDNNGDLIETFTRTLNTTAVDEQQPENTHFQIFPAGKTIKVMNPQNIKGELFVFDDFGRIIYRNNLVTGENKIFVKSTGIYFVRITEGNRIITVQKVFVR
jgi:hypothetical protein